MKSRIITPPLILSYSLDTPGEREEREGERGTEGEREEEG